MRPIFRLTKLAFPRAPKRKEALPPGIEPRPYYAPSHIATTAPSRNIKSKEKGALPPGIELRTSYAIRQERTSRFYLRVEWTFAFKGFHLRKGCTSTAVSGLILGSLRSGDGDGDGNENDKNAICLGYVYIASDESSTG